MTTFTKASNIILRGTIVTAMAAAVIQLTSGAHILANLFTGADAVADMTANAGNMNLTYLISHGHILTITLLLASLLSCFAFRCAGKAASTFRTATLLGLAGTSAVGTFLFHTSDVLVRTMNGTASVTELAEVKPIIDAAVESGSSQGAVAGSLTTIGLAAPLFIAAVLAILSITSIVSVVKTVKAARAESKKHEIPFKVPEFQM